MDEEASAINLRGQFRCDECGLNLNSERGVRKHSALHFTSRPFVCDQCGWRFSVSNTLKIHQATHQEDKPFQCDECSQRFALKMRLMDHKLKHSKIMPHVCAECGEGFNRPCKLKEHQLKKHFRIYEGKQRPDRGERGEREEKKSEGKLLLNLQQLRMESDHRGALGGERDCGGERVCRGESEQKEKKSGRKRCLNLQQLRTERQQQYVHGKGFECSRCGRSFRKKRSLLIHSCAHSEAGSGRHRCEEDRCGQSFPTAAELRRHRQFHVEAGQTLRFKCADCDRGFTSRKRLISHKQLHSGKRSLRSDRGQVFISEGHLSLHRPLHKEMYGEGHSDEERFSSFHLREHKKVHHKESRADKEVHDSNESPNLQKIHEDDCQNQEINNKKVYRCDKCGRDHRLNQPHACRQHRHGERRSGDPSAKSRRCFTCRECEVQLQLDRTALVNVFSVTNFAHVRCFVDSHTLI